MRHDAPVKIRVLDSLKRKRRQTEVNSFSNQPSDAKKKALQRIAQWKKNILARGEWRVIK